jgi:hypothetical protein
MHVMELQQRATSRYRLSTGHDYPGVRADRHERVLERGILEAVQCPDFGPLTMARHDRHLVMFGPTNAEKQTEFTSFSSTKMP